MLKTYLPLLFLAISYSSIHGQTFKKAETTFHGVMQPVTTWVNHNKTSKLTAFLGGDYYNNNTHFIVSQTNAYYSKNKFKHIFTNLPALYRGDAASADYDGDGDDDIIVTGINKNNKLLMQLYRNNGKNRFKLTKEVFTPTSDGSVEWGDFDNDKDLDILVTGLQNNNLLSTYIYRNDNGVFTQIDLGIPGVYYGNATWGDFDNDGDLDILITGNVGDKPITAVYKNTNNTYKKVAQHTIQLMNSDAAWGDFDNDNFIDFIVSGETFDGYPVCIIYKNYNGSFFKEIVAPIRALTGCSIDLGDFDNDNDLDIIMTGESLESSYTTVYENKSDFNFENIIAGLPGVANGNALWGDYDKDGDLDILLSGITVCYDFVGDIYINSQKAQKKESSSSIFITSPMPNVKIGPYYYYVFSSCFCDPKGGDNYAYHMYVSNVHIQNKKYELNNKYNELLINKVPNWGEVNRGYRTSSGFETKAKANASRKQVIESYKSTNFTIHELNW